MIYTALTNQALKLAYAAHDGQKDKAGMPYILHPLHLAEQMDDEISTCVALLHDVIEDTDWTIESLSEIFPSSVIDRIRLLTRTKGIPYFEYIQKLGRDPVARKVKLADLAHNSDLSRYDGCSDFDPKSVQSLMQRYALAADMLKKLKK